MRTRLDVVGALLLGARGAGLLFPLVSVEGGLSPVPFVLLAGARCCWCLPALGDPARRAAARQPLLDVSLLRQVPGYGSGLAVGAIYFTGFTGIFLVLSVHLQQALDYSPLAGRAAADPVRAGRGRDRARWPAAWSPGSAGGSRSSRWRS